MSKLHSAKSLDGTALCTACSPKRKWEYKRFGLHVIGASFSWIWVYIACLNNEMFRPFHRPPSGWSLICYKVTIQYTMYKNSKLSHTCSSVHLLMNFIFLPVSGQWFVGMINTEQMNNLRAYSIMWLPKEKSNPSLNFNRSTEVNPTTSLNLNRSTKVNPTRVATVPKHTIE
jgi:hypothetical protein